MGALFPDVIQPVNIILAAHFLDCGGDDLFFEQQTETAISGAHDLTQHVDLHALEYSGFSLADVGGADHPSAALRDIFQ